MVAKSNRRSMCAVAVLSAIGACNGRTENDPQNASGAGTITPASFGGWSGFALGGTWAGRAGFGGIRAEVGGASGMGGMGGEAGVGGEGAACSSPPDGYPDILYGGAWMCGWSGDLDHYSWLIFMPNSSGGSGAWLALDARCTTCTGYLECEGTGTFGLGERLGSVILVNPPDCPQRNDALLITRLCEPSAGVFPDAEAMMDVEHGGSAVECYRFSIDHCDSELTVCGGPY